MIHCTMQLILATSGVLTLLQLHSESTRKKRVLLRLPL
jgi:hypothetical protein